MASWLCSAAAVSDVLAMVLAIAGGGLALSRVARHDSSSGWQAVTGEFLTADRDQPYRRDAVAQSRALVPPLFS